MADVYEMRERRRRGAIWIKQEQGPGFVLHLVLGPQLASVLGEENKIACSDSLESPGWAERGTLALERSSLGNGWQYRTMKMAKDRIE